MTHTIQLLDFLDYLNEEHFHTCVSQAENKKLQIQIGGTKLRVLSGQEIVYEGFDPQRAINTYNSITNKQDLGIKIDN